MDERVRMQWSGADSIVRDFIINHCTMRCIDTVIYNQESPIAWSSKDVLRQLPLDSASIDMTRRNVEGGQLVLEDILEGSMYCDVSVHESS